MNVRINWKKLTVIGIIAIAMLSRACQANAAPKRILLVFESEVYSPAGWEFQQGILAHLRGKLGQDTEFFSEQLEANRLAEFREQTLSWVRTRYSNRHVDVVIFLGINRPDILPGVPTVYAGFNPVEQSKDIGGREGKVTVLLRTDFSATVAAARRLQPNAKKMMVIAGAGFGDQDLLEQARNQLRGLDLPTEYLANKTVDDLLILVAHLPSDTIVLPISYTRDLEGSVYYTPDVIASLSKVSTAPVYAVADTAIGSGAVGGYVVDFDKAGAVIANVVMRTLAGESESQIVVQAKDIASYRFDWRQLKRWDFPERRLPPGSIIEFKTPTAWEQFRWRIIGIFVLVLCQFVLILALLIHRSRRIRAEASLHEMTGRLLASQDDERRRIARDLHDGTGQHLSGMALTIGQVLADFPPGYDRLRQLLQESHSASRQALEEVRTVSFVLHPPILDGVGLLRALHWYLDGLRKRTAIRIDLIAPNNLGHLSPEVERAVFRMVQEGVTNVLRHSGGTALRVSLSTEARTVTLKIEDNGKGLNEDQLLQPYGAASTLGVGIAGMRERIRQLHGEFQLESDSNGTRVSAIVPLNEGEYAANPAG
jgi:signal transduction histidine kinase